MDKGKKEIKEQKSKTGDENMDIAIKNNEKYNPLDIKVLRSKKSTTISYEESLKDIKPIDWSDEVLSGKKKITIKGSK